MILATATDSLPDDMEIQLPQTPMYKFMYSVLYAQVTAGLAMDSRAL